MVVRKSDSGRHEDKDYPAEYYLNQEELFDEDEFTDGDYSDSSMLLLDFIKERLH